MLEANTAVPFRYHPVGGEHTVLSWAVSISFICSVAAVICQVSGFDVLGQQ